MSCSPDEMCAGVKQLLDSNKVLIFTHQRPDGDALGSSFGLKYFLEAQGKSACVFIPGSIPHRHTKLFQGYLSEMTQEEFDSFDTIVAVHEQHPHYVISPCGNCRQMLFEYCPDIMVIINDNGNLFKVKARDLLPFAWEPIIC